MKREGEIGNDEKGNEKESIERERERERAREQVERRLW